MDLVLIPKSKKNLIEPTLKTITKQRDSVFGIYRIIILRQGNYHI